MSLAQRVRHAGLIDETVKRQSRQSGGANIGDISDCCRAATWQLRQLDKQPNLPLAQRPLTVLAISGA
jgi:hypothetical protein